MSERVGEKERDESLGARGENTLLDAVRSLDERAPERLRESTRAGLRHLASAALVLFGLALVPYASPSLARWQAWAPGDGVPIARMIAREPEGGSGMEIATGGAVRHRGTPLADQIGEAVAANLEDGAEPAPVAQRVEPGPPRDAGGPRVRIAPSELEGLVREIEDPSGRAMRPFYEALLRTAQREEGAITRIAHYGDSSIAGDGITSTLRRRFQQRFGDAGHGFILIARGTMPYRHQDVRHDSSGDWRLIELVRAGLRERTYGYGGVQYRSASGATARFGTTDDGPIGTRVSRFELWYQQHERGGRVQLRVDGGEWTTLETRGETADAWHAIDVPDGP
ncbi:MAG TPA: hypothetical protein VIL20_07370, partial [Sandaracinaceae bacterium]